MIEKCLGKLETSLKYTFGLTQGLFPDKLKIAKLNPFYKKCEKTDKKLFYDFSAPISFKMFWRDHV